MVRIMYLKPWIRGTKGNRVFGSILLAILTILERNGVDRSWKLVALLFCDQCSIRCLTVLRKRKLLPPCATESRKRYSIVVKASKSQAQPSEAVSEVLKSVQEAWEKTDDKLAIGGLGFAGLVLLWASTGLLSAIDKLPIIPDFFEFVGVLFSVWFTYRYLLFKPDREELLKTVNEAKGRITGE